jgi:hypothetical protein
VLTTPMLERYSGEDQAENNIWPGGSAVEYLDKSQRTNLELKVENGKFYDASGKLFDTSGAATLHSDEDGFAIFVMDEEGQIFASKRHEQGKFHHSSLVAGAPVAAAGEIVVKNGVLKKLTDRSGHYRPSKVFTDQIVSFLKRQNVNLPDDNIQLFVR